MKQPLLREQPPRPGPPRLTVLSLTLTASLLLPKKSAMVCSALPHKSSQALASPLTPTPHVMPYFLSLVVSPALAILRPSILQPA